MADKPTKPPGSVTQPADTKNERIAEVSNVNRVVSEMQQKVDQQLAEASADVGQYEGIEDVQNSMIKVLGTLNTTVGSLGHGFAKIAAVTGKASTDAFKQYGKAISEDIALNKRNIVATALSQTSPIFGYFAAKFVETDVFQTAAQKMKSNISEALGGVTSKFKEGFGNIISRAKFKGEKEKPIKRIKSKVKKERPIKGIDTKAKIPKMQTGGYVEKGGLAKLHPAEVVVPIDKILSRIDESIDVTKNLALISRRAQLNTLAKMSTYVKSVEQLEKVGVFKGFMRAMRQVQTQYTEPSDVRQLRALLAIQDALGAQIGTMQQVWQKMLVNHPVFRNITFAMKGLATVFGAPFKFVYGVFKSRGGYQAHLSKDRNPMKAMVENIGLVYSEGMWRLDNIALFTKATAEATRDLTSALTGKKYPPLEGVPTGVWSFANLAVRLGGLILGKKRKSRRRALKELYGGVGSSKRASAFLPKAKGDEDLRIKELYGGGASTLLPKEISDEALRISALPVSEIHLARFSKQAEKYMVDSKKYQQKQLGYSSDIYDLSEDEYKVTTDMNKRERRRTIFGFFGGAFGAVRSLIGGGLAMLLPIITGALTGLWATLFPGGIALALSKVIGSSLVAAAGKVLVAGAFGAAIGITIDKFVGVSEGFKAHLDRLDKLASEVGAANIAKTQERFGRARGGGMKGYESVEALKIQAQIGMFKERKEDLGMWGRGNIADIGEAQARYMNENINEYLKYGAPQIQMLRGKWLQEGGYKSKRPGYPALQYGAEREAAFLKYVQQKGTAQTSTDINKAYEAYSEKISITDRLGGAWKDTSDFAREKAAEALVQTKAMQEGLKEHAKKLAEDSEKIGAGIASSVNQATTAVTTHIQNTSSNVNNAAQRVKDIFSEYDHAVIRGDYMSEDF